MDFSLGVLICKPVFCKKYSKPSALPISFTQSSELFIPTKEIHIYSTVSRESVCSDSEMKTLRANPSSSLQANSAGTVSARPRAEITRVAPRREANPHII